MRIPADVDMEDRILGRLTARQVAILGSAAVVLYLLWLALRAVVPVMVLLIAAAPVAAVVAVVALGRRDGISMDRLVVAAARYVVTTRPPRHHTQAPVSPSAAPGASPDGDGAVGVPGWLTAATTPAPLLSGTSRTGGSVGGAVRVPTHRPPPPARHVRPPVGRGSEVGVIDLGAQGLAAVAVCSTVAFALRTPREQTVLCAVFGGFLNAATAPVQILVRAVRVELGGQIDALHDAAATLPHPALAAAALDHAAHLADLTREHDLLRRQVLLVVRESHPDHPAPPATGRGLLARIRHRIRPGHGEPNTGDAVDPARTRAEAATETRLLRRIAEARDLLAAAGIVVAPLDDAGARAVLSAACHPGTIPDGLPGCSDTAGPLAITTGGAWAE
ncbi:PrgI family protein [Pseudonocardia sp. CA-107938]|uniref:PrgI family protein n=1 Tax=Pseudonocardia sp. CA-107938 TaxID=3240021 RepID=UPI003D8E54F7